MRKLDTRGVEQSISVREKQLLHIIESNPGIKTSDIAVELDVSNATVKRMLENLIVLRMIERQGIGRGSYYTLL